MSLSLPDEVFVKKAGYRYTYKRLHQLPNGAWTDNSVTDPVWAKDIKVGESVIVSSRDHPDPDCRFTNGRRGAVIELSVSKGHVGYSVSVLGSPLNENARGQARAHPPPPPPPRLPASTPTSTPPQTGYFVTEDMVTVITALDQRVNLSLATDEELATVAATLRTCAFKVGNGSIDVDRAIKEIKEKRPFKHGWKGICGLVDQDGMSYGTEVKKEKIYFFTELTLKWLENVCTPGDGAEKTKAFREWGKEADGFKERSWNENLEKWNALQPKEREYYYDIVLHSATVQKAALKVKNAEKKKLAQEAAEKREADRAAGVGRPKRAAAAAADGASKRQREIDRELGL